MHASDSLLAESLSHTALQCLLGRPFPATSRSNEYDIQEQQYTSKMSRSPQRHCRVPGTSKS